MLNQIMDKKKKSLISAKVEPQISCKLFNHLFLTGIVPFFIKIYYITCNKFNQQKTNLQLQNL